MSFAPITSVSWLEYEFTTWFLPCPQLYVGLFCCLLLMALQLVLLHDLFALGLHTLAGLFYSGPRTLAPSGGVFGGLLSPQLGRPPLATPSFSLVFPCLLWAYRVSLPNSHMSEYIYTCWLVVWRPLRSDY